MISLNSLGARLHVVVSAPKKILNKAARSRACYRPGTRVYVHALDNELGVILGSRNGFYQVALEKSRIIYVRQRNLSPMITKDEELSAIGSLLMLAKAI